MDASSNRGFETDRPLVDSADDALNRKPFVKQIAQVLLGIPAGEGLVVGIHGPWGDGKTTVLNLLAQELRDSKQIEPTTFNPWRFTDETSMLGGFFRELAQAVNATLRTRGESAAALVRTFAKYAAVLDDRFDTLSDRAGEIADTGLETTRDRLRAELQRSDKKIVVMIDDIDRLEKHEIQILFRLVKACADLPNVSYVLAFDEVMVASALSEKYGTGDESSGRAFLEKIIQVPLKLPVAAREDLRQLCFTNVDGALSSSDVRLSSEDVGDFIFAFDASFRARLTTPRAAKRFANGLRFAIPALIGDVRIVDLMLIEGLRAFYPEIHDVIRANHAAFSGVESAPLMKGSPPHWATLLTPLTDILPERERHGVEHLLTRLFPRLAATFSNVHYGPDHLASWQREKRVCSPMYCARYFSYAVPVNQVSNSEVEQIVDLASAGDFATLTHEFGRVFDGPKVTNVIERLRELEGEVGPMAARQIARAIAQFGHRLPAPREYSPARPLSQAAILVAQLLKTIPAGAERLDAAREIIADARPLQLALECIRWAHYTSREENQDDNALSEEEVVDLRALLVERIRSASLDGDFLFDPEKTGEHSLLYEWWRVDGREPVERHLVAVFARDASQVSRFLRCHAPIGRPLSGGPQYVSDLDMSQLDDIASIIDLDAMASWVRNTCPGDLDNPQYRRGHSVPVDQRLAEQFMYLLNKRKAASGPKPSAGTSG